MQEKPCKKCGETKPLELFSRDRSRPDGRRNACKACDVIHDANPTFKERRAGYNRSEAGKAAFRKYRRTERGAALNKARIERVRNEPWFRKQRVGWVMKYASSEKGQAALARYRATTNRKAYAKGWNAANIDKKREYGRQGMHRRQARIRALPATFTYTQWRHALAYFGYRCAYCGSDRKLLQEHFVPVEAGGPYTAQNIVPACQSCNNRKRSKDPERWCSPDVYAAITAYFASLT